MLDLNWIDIFRTQRTFTGGVIQPGLRAAGVDTREVDKHLMTGYGHYNKLRENINDGIEVIDNVAAHVRGGTYQYR